jgi:hypothetical protein
MTYEARHSMSERVSCERKGGVEITVPTRGKVQTFLQFEFPQTDQFIFCRMAKSYVELCGVIEDKEKDKLSVREIMMRFKCGKTKIYNTFKQTDKIRKEWLQGNVRR